MFIADRIPKGLYIKNTYTESRVLNVQENIKKEIYMYRVNKIASPWNVYFVSDIWNGNKFF